MAKFQETVIDLIRHGEPEGGNKLRGTLDDPLSEQGWQQMWQAVGQFRAWQHLCSSPLLRCRDFAHALADDMQLPVQVNSHFREIAFGEWEGLTTKELMQRDPHALKRYWQDPDQHLPAGAESLSAFSARVHGAWRDLVAAQQGKHSLLVCHGGVIRAILVDVLGMPIQKMWNFDVPYANVSRVVYHHFDDGTHTAQLRFHQRRLYDHL
ncbi:MAG: histidine phosphatase family protein [Oleiphilaceae bacterium]|nr:histidine phosphatase family protein [Oleiphilaceae bacterium]